MDKAGPQEEIDASPQVIIKTSSESLTFFFDSDALDMLVQRVARSGIESRVDETGITENDHDRCMASTPSAATIYLENARHAAGHFTWVASAEKYACRGR